jgi:hypothetical protein
MKLNKFLAILFGIITIFSIGCEPDDICAETTPTTPSLIIRFFDISNPESRKNVVNLLIQGVGNENPLPDYNVKTTDSIVIPLNTIAISTSYKLHKEYQYIDDVTPPRGNEDTITINYTTEQVYVSRACGYKTIFKNVTLTINGDADNWIKSQESLIENQTVEDETSAHFKLFH